MGRTIGLYRIQRQKFLKNLRNSCEGKKMDRSDDPENLTTQEGNIQAVPISGHRPVPSSSAASTLIQLCSCSR